MPQDFHTAPPFSRSSAIEVTRRIENAWNSREPELVVEWLSHDAEWQDRGQSLIGHDAIRTFVATRWRQELHQRTSLEIQSHAASRIHVRAEREWQHARTGQWYRTTGEERWSFDPRGLIHRREAAGDDEPIGSGDRRVGFQRD